MIVAVIDNGSLEPAAHLNLRAVAKSLSARTGVHVRAVSWKHSDRISPEYLDDTPAWVLAHFVRVMFALGQREFVFVPYFVSPQGAIGSALRHELEQLQRQIGDFTFTFTDGLADRGVIPGIVADRIRSTLAAAHDQSPLPVVLVDHGGPSSISAAIRDETATALQRQLGHAIESITAASMEGAHPPLLAEVLSAPGFAARDVLVALLFLSPGRHAGASGDVARLCAESPARCQLTGVIGNHPSVIEALAAALRDALSPVHAQPFA